MAEQVYVLDGFGRHFEAFKGKTIYLYGQKAYTQAIIENYHGEYRFAGVLSDTDASGEFYGVPLVHVDELESKRPDMVILSEPKKMMGSFFMYLFFVASQKITKPNAMACKMKSDMLSYCRGF